MAVHSNRLAAKLSGCNLQKAVLFNSKLTIILDATDPAVQNFA
ncbi:MAG: hypothetical protein ACRECZ_03645 [Methylocella sp.]